MKLAIMIKIGNMKRTRRMRWDINTIQYWFINRSRHCRQVIFFEFSSVSSNGFHAYKMYELTCSLCKYTIFVLKYIRVYFFSCNAWNSLPDSVSFEEIAILRILNTVDCFVSFRSLDVRLTVFLHCVSKNA